MLLLPFDQINVTDMHRLCSDRCSESQTLEFKRELPGNADKDKHEICKDIAALANTDGGDIVYGIDEQEGSAGSLQPMSIEPPDSAMRRIAQVLDAGVEPRIRGIRMRQVDVPGGYCLVIRVEQSFDGPHCIRIGNNRRFVLRNGTSTSDMTYEQIRGAFDRTASLAQQARNFITERLDQVAKRSTTAPILPGPQWAVHLVPVGGMGGRHMVDLKNVYESSWTGFIGNDWGGGGRTFNFDGLLIHPGGQNSEGYYTYKHVFRTGALEAVQLGGNEYQGKKIVWSLDMSKFLHQSAEMFLEKLKVWGFSGPAVLSVSILNVHGYELGIGGSYYPFKSTTADRPHLTPPSAWIEDINNLNLDSTIRPLMDNLWQGFGQVRCLDFKDETGAFSPRRS